MLTLINNTLSSTFVQHDAQSLRELTAQYKFLIQTKIPQRGVCGVFCPPLFVVSRSANFEKTPFSVGKPQLTFVMTYRIVGERGLADKLTIKSSDLSAKTDRKWIIGFVAELDRLIGVNSSFSKVRQHGI